MNLPGLFPIEDDEDRMIVNQVLAGHKELFVVLVKRYERAIHGMGHSFLRNDDDVFDFTQDVFLKVFKSLGKFEGRSRFSTWIFRIAYNTALNSVSRKKEYVSLANDDVIPDFDTPERKAIRSELCKTVQETVRDLPERYKVCVDLFFFYDRSYQEIEIITGFPVNTIKSHVFRAKKILREKLEDFF